MGDDINTCAANLAEAQAYLQELLVERDDATEEEIREARHEVARCRQRYNEALVDDGMGKVLYYACVNEGACGYTAGDGDDEACPLCGSKVVAVREGSYE